MNVKKCCVLLVFIIFLIETTAGQANTTTALKADSISIPKGLGKITEFFKGESDHWVIQIQDIHAHFLAQENISAIIDLLNARHGIQTVAVEGGWSEASFPKSWGIPNSRHKQLLARSLMEGSHIAGPVHAALFSKVPLQIVGVEDVQLYQSNLEQYRQYLNNYNSIHSKIKFIEDALKREKTITYNNQLLLFDREVSKFRTGQKAEGFLPELMKQIKKHNIDLTAFPQTHLFDSILNLEKQIDEKKLQDEADRLMQNFKNSRFTFEEILRGNNIPREKLQYYPNATRYLELMQLQEQLDHRGFFGEIEKIIHEVQNKLIKTEAEEQLAIRSDRFLIAKAILSFQATPDHLITHQKYASSIENDIREYELTEDLSNALAFYRDALKRDKVFFNQLKSNPKLQKDVIIVTGGFHTQGLSELLKKEKQSYVVITPEIGKEAPEEKLYHERLQDPVPVTQTLSHEQNRYAFLDENFARGLTTLIRENNINKAVSIATRFSHSGSNGRHAKRSRSGTLTFKAFNKLSPEKQQALIKKLFDKARKAVKPVSIVIRASTLEQLLENDAGRTIWEEVVARERMNRIVIIRDSNNFLDATIGISARIERVSGQLSIEDVLRTRLRNQTNVAVIDADYLRENPRAAIAALPESPVSLMLARLVVEQQMSFELTDDLLAAFEEEITQFFVAEGILAQSA